MRPASLWLVALATLIGTAIAIVVDDGLVDFPLAARWPYLPAEVRNTLVSSAAAAVLLQFLLVGAYVLYLSRTAQAVRPAQVLFVALLTAATLVWLALSLGNVYEIFVDNTRQGPFAIWITMLSIAALPIVGIFALGVRTQGLSRGDGPNDTRLVHDE